MTSHDYKAIVTDAVRRLGRLSDQHAEIEIEIGKLRQFIRATIHLLPDPDRKRFLKWFEGTKLIGDPKLKKAGLTENIREIFEIDPKKWFTVTQMRNALEASGFDFAKYTSNPLASISATLKRMHPREIEADVTETGVAVSYRWKPNTKFAKLRRAKRRQEVEREKFAAVHGDEWARFDPFQAAYDSYNYAVNKGERDEGEED
jgi:hypothetical protein